MNRRKLVVLGGLIAIAIIVLRRRSRRNVMEIEIDEPGTRDRSFAGPDTRDRSLAAPDTRDQPAPEDGSAVELESIEGIGPAYATRLHEAGVTNVADLETVDPDDLAQESGIGEARIRGWVERARDRENA